MAKALDCIVIGGGIVGLSIARRLAGESLNVGVFEKGACGREASWAGAGMLAPLDPHRKDALARLNAASRAMYEAFCGSLCEDSGIDPEFHRCGELQLIFDENQLRVAKSFEVASPDPEPEGGGGRDFELLSPDQAIAVEPQLAPQIRGALLARRAAQIRNPRLMAALKASCLGRGVEIHEGRPVYALEVDGTRAVGVRIPDSVVHAKWIVLAAGAWSSQVHPRLAKLIPVYPVRGQIILLKFEKPPLSHIVSHKKTYVVPRLDGHVLIGATEEHESGFSHKTSARGISGLIESALRLVPVLGDAPVEMTWAGLRPGTPDVRPHIGDVPGFDGLVAATGHFRSGLVLAPAVAEYVASRISGRDYPIDLSAFAPGRSMEAAQPAGPVG